MVNYFIIRYGNDIESHTTTNNEMKITIFLNIGYIVTSSAYIKHHLPPPAAPL